MVPGNCGEDVALSKPICMEVHIANMKKNSVWIR